MTKPQTRTALEVGVHALLASEAWWQQAGCAGFGQGGIFGECSRGTGQRLPLDGQATLHNRCLLRAHSTCVGILPNETEHQAAVPCWRRRVGWHPADRNAAQGGWNQSALRKISGGGAQIIFELRCVFFPLPNRETKVSAPGPPETHAEVAPIIKSKMVKHKHLAASDSGTAFKKTWKEMGLEAASARHGRAEFTPLVKLSKANLASDVLQNITAKKAQARPSALSGSLAGIRSARA